MKERTINLKQDKIKANRRSKIVYLLAKLFPKQFGRPLHVQIKVYNPLTGQIKATQNIYNTVTQVGLNGIADQLLASPSIGKPTHMAIGTGTGGTTSLNNELDRNALTSKTRNTDTITMVGDWAAGDGTGALTEAGVFNASSSGDMYLYTTFSVVNKAAADALQITWTLEIS